MDNNFRLTGTWSKNYRQLRELARFYGQIIAEIKLKQVRLYTALDQTFPEEEQLFKNRVSKLALNVISLFPHPDFLQGLSQTRLKNKLMAQTAKKLSKTKGLKYAKKLLEFAQHSYPATDADSIQVQEVQYYCCQLIDLTKKKNFWLLRWKP